MSLTEIFRPKTESDLVGNVKAIKKVKECLKSKRVFILHGDPGIGKTSAVHALARDLGMKVYERNASDRRKKEDMKSFLRQLSSKPFVPTVFLLDEIDGAESFKIIEKCIKNAQNPLALICNNFYKIPRRVTQLCERIRFYNPRINEVSAVIQRIEKETGMKADHSRLSHDIRNSINNAFFGGKRYNSENNYEIIKDAFRGKIKDLNRNHFIWLLDNAPNFHRGRSLHTFLQMLAVADRIERFEPITTTKSSFGSGKVEYPRYIKRARILKRKRKKK